MVSGDVIGCGIDGSTGAVGFWVNGTFLGVACKGFGKPGSIFYYPKFEYGNGNCAEVSVTTNLTGPFV